MLWVDKKYLRLIASRFRNSKWKNEDLLNHAWPYCGDSEKTQHKARGYVFKKDNTLIYKCHNCGIGASLKNLLKHIDIKIHNDYIFERYKKTDDVRPDICKFTKPKFLKGDSPLKKLK